MRDFEPTIPLVPAVPGQETIPVETPAGRLRRYALSIAYAARPKRIAHDPLLPLQVLFALFARGPKVPDETALWPGRYGFGGYAFDTAPATVLAAGRNGFYPDAHMGPQRWWSPEKRAVMRIAEVNVPKRFRRTLKTTDMTVAFDTAFVATMRACAAPRPGRPPLTWITPDAMRLYTGLFEAGYAHSCEVRDGAGALVGGLFGVALGPVFSALSMFHTADNASKLAIVSLYHHLDAWGFTAVDHQDISPWVAALGGREIPRADYVALLRGDGPVQAGPGRWQARFAPKDTAGWEPKRAEDALDMMQLDRRTL